MEALWPSSLTNHDVNYKTLNCDSPGDKATGLPHMFEAMVFGEAGGPGPMNRQVLTCMKLTRFLDAKVLDSRV